MSSEVVRFIRARLDEDERLAGSAGGGSWDVGEQDGLDWSWSILGEDAQTSRYDPVLKEYVAIPIRRTIVGPGYEGGGVDGRPVAEHIVRWNPARVLAEIAAKRLLLDFLDPTDAPEGEGRFVAKRALLLLALSWVNHPDHAGAWKGDLLP